jgi:hypothetical protein
VSVGADRWIQRTTIGCAGLLALIADTVSNQRMHMLVEHRQPGWVAALTPVALQNSMRGLSCDLARAQRSEARCRRWYGARL